MPLKRTGAWRRLRPALGPAGTGTFPPSPTHHACAERGGTTFCTFYHDRRGRTASNLVPRGSVVLLSRGGTAIRVRITDRGVRHFDLTPSQFRRFAPLSRGVVPGIHYRVLSRG